MRTTHYFPSTTQLAESFKLGTSHKHFRQQDYKQRCVNEEVCSAHMYRKKSTMTIQELTSTDW